MRISYRTHPSLKFIETGSIEILFDEKDKHDYGIIAPFVNSKCAQFLSSIDKNNIIKPANSFVQSAWVACKKLLFSSNDKEYTDHLIGRSGVLLIHETTIFFSFKISPKQNIIMEYITFENKFNTLIDFSFQNGETVSQQAVWQSKCIEKASLPGHLQSVINYNYYKQYVVMTVLLFQKYAQVETKYLPAKQKVKDINCNYKNDTSFDITYLDSTWFTNLVKSDAFKVRGHFRLQPKKKEGEWTKELIWITEFEKHGYTAPARKLNLQA